VILIHFADYEVVLYAYSSTTSGVL